MIEKLKNLLITRKQAYGQVFTPGVFSAKVLDDLSRFCRAEQSTFHVDERAHVLMEGRREVWLRIKDHLDLDVKQMVEKYGGIKHE